MDRNLKPEERELIKLVQHFKKRAQILLAENRLAEEHGQMLETCDKFVEQLQLHAQIRETVLAEYQKLKEMIKDNAKCPSCSSNEMIKLIGFDTNSKGWKSNRYKCRRCNIAFTWNTPNNPWDMIPYVEEFISNTEQKLAGEDPTDPNYEFTKLSLEQMRANLGKLKPVVEASDLDMKELNERDAQMADIVHKFKKHLMIEKIKMED
jgi:hypothetical protein